MMLPAEVAALGPRLRRGADALGLGLTDRQCEQLLLHLTMIQHWNRVYNLTAVRDPMQMLSQHVLDSLSIVGPLRRHTGEAPASLLDVGSGAGLPGVTLAIVCPELAVTCVDAVDKKVSFVRQVSAELGLRQFDVLHARVETLEARPWDVITSRAFASLADFVRMTRHLIAPGGVWMAMKGRISAEELAALPAAIEVFHVEPLQVPELNAERCILWMKKRQQVGEADLTC